MNIFVVSIKKVSVADDQVQYGISVAVGSVWISAENVKNGSAVVVSGRDLTIAVVVGLTPWVS
jgi:hypothetical protein